MEDAYVGIDLGFAKEKRLPVAVACHRRGTLSPLPLRRAQAKPPAGRGNVRILNSAIVAQFAQDAAAYLQAVESEFGVRIRRVAIDAPSHPREPDAPRRACEVGLDHRRISCITTPSEPEFGKLLTRCAAHLEAGGRESELPGANQLWMLVGFALFRELRRVWECLEVFPQAIVAVLQAHAIHKSREKGLRAQLKGVARYTNWPSEATGESLLEIGYGGRHDKLDAYMAAWVASLDEGAREAIGCPPADAIWIPRLLSRG